LYKALFVFVAFVDPLLMSNRSTLATPTPVEVILHTMERRNDPFVESAMNASQMLVSSVPVPSKAVFAVEDETRNVGAAPRPKRPVFE
jgi:hypothetical protein